MDAFLLLVFLLLGVNVWAMRCLLAVPDDWGVPKRMLIAGIWIIPFVGALIAVKQIPRLADDAVQGDAEAALAAQPDAPLFLRHEGGNAFDVQANLACTNHVPLLNWCALSDWAQSAPTPEAAVLAVEQGRLAWLLHFRDALNAGFHVHVTDNACILSRLTPRLANTTAHYVRTARSRITRVLGGLAHFPANERSILVVLETEEDYYQYISIYYPDEGEFSFSGGIFVDAGCPHFVMVRADIAHIEPVIAHELTHSALAHLRLPKWLDEGLAVNTEYKISGVKSQRQTPQQLHYMHQNFWDAQRIQEFWSGASFDRADEGNLLSYELARIIVEKLSQPWDRFAQFVADAQSADAGAAAAQKHLSIDLGALVMALLEVDSSASWEPTVSA